MAAEKFAYVPNGIAISEWTDNAGPLPAAPRSHRSHPPGGAVPPGLCRRPCPLQPLDTLIEAAAAFETQNVATVLVGQGAEKERLQRRAAELRLERTLFLPPLPKKLIPALLSELDACYLGWTRSPLYRFGICPNKLLEYMMAAKPVIHAVEAANDLVAEAGCGLTVPPEDPAALVDGVGRLSGLAPWDRRVLGQRGRDYVVARHDYSVLARRFLATIGGDTPQPPVSQHETSV